MQNKKIYILLLAALTALGASARKGERHIKISPDSIVGFRAHQYVLQKPLGNPEFPEDNVWNNRFFIGLGGGIEGIADEYNNGNDAIKIGGRISAEAGYWFTPVMGMRLGIDAGTHSTHQRIERSWFGGGRAEFLVNFTTLMRGYDPRRRFELIGAVGVVGQRMRVNRQWIGMTYGTTASLQARFNVQPSLYLYVEPRMTMLTGKHYDAPFDWRRTRMNLSLNVGLGYRILTGAQRSIGSSPFMQTNDDNLYFGVGGGITEFSRPKFPELIFENHSPIGTAYVGKMFTAASGVEFSLDFGRLHTAGNWKERQYFATSTLSYVVNLNNACGGYRPNQRFQMALALGPSVAFTYGKAYGGAATSLTATYNVTPNIGIFLRPQVGLYNHHFAYATQRNQSFLTTLTMGLRYTVGQFSTTHARSYDEFYGSDASHWFIQGSMGLTWRTLCKYGTGQAVAASVGKRFTPVSSWRLGIDASIYDKHPQPMSAVLTLDYLSSVSTAMAGYDPARRFDLEGVVGVYAGINNFARHNSATYGLRGGLQANIRVDRNTEIFLEPLFLATRAYTERYWAKKLTWIPELRIYAGVKYRFGADDMKAPDYKATPDNHRNFIGIAAGPSLFSASYTRPDHHVAAALDIAAGHWFSSVSGARVVYSNDWIHNSDYYYGEEHAVRLSAVHVDYLLNITSIVNRAAENRFHVIGALGLGAGFSKSKKGFATYAGLQLRYNLPYGLDIHLEPGVGLWANGILPHPTMTHRFHISGRVTAGISLRF